MDYAGESWEAYTSEDGLAGDWFHRDSRTTRRKVLRKMAYCAIEIASHPWYRRSGALRLSLGARHLIIAQVHHAFSASWKHYSVPLSKPITALLGMESEISTATQTLQARQRLKEPELTGTETLQPTTSTPTFGHPTSLLGRSSIASVQFNEPFGRLSDEPAQLAKSMFSKQQGIALGNGSPEVPKTGPGPGFGYAVGSVPFDLATHVSRSRPGMVAKSSVSMEKDTDAIEIDRKLRLRRSKRRSSKVVQSNLEVP